ncbi:hypothetical protein BTW01_08280 [Bacillus sp. SKDU12]|nr:hypothetical protein BTW01_08280 [Bacillus sp. SKDU12]
MAIALYIIPRHSVPMVLVLFCCSLCYGGQANVNHFFKKVILIQQIMTQDREKAKIGTNE